MPPVNNFPTSKKILLAGVAVAALVSLFLAGQIFETNDAGYVQVKQAAGSGTMSVRLEPGVYFKMFSTINTYKISDAYNFDKDETIGARFNDASTADISGQIKFRLPVDEQKLLLINQDFRSYEAVEEQLIRQVVASAIKQTASLFGSEEAYSTRRSDFVTLVNQQIQNGIYATSYAESTGNDGMVVRTTSIKTDSKGNAIVSEQSALKHYGIDVVQFVINDINFDEKTKELIAKRKEADQEKIVAKAKAERAQQDALTAKAQGDANVATATAEANVKKATAVIAAEQEKEVSQQQALKAQQEKIALVAKGEGEAEAARLKVQAGLTPLDRATIDKETAIGVAHELANVKFPQTMVISGGEGANGGSVSPISALGMQAMYQLSKTMAADTSATSHSNEKDDK